MKSEGTKAGSQVDFENVVPRLRKIVARGLSNGPGVAGGQVCIEAAVCEALGQPHGDRPACVEPEVRQYKIGLNDSKYWPSPEVRASGMLALGIAQLGSLGSVPGVKFRSHLAEKTIRVLLPRLFRQLARGRAEWLEAADRCEREGSRNAAQQARKVAANATAATAADAADAAADADAADAAAYSAGVFYLRLSAALALETLIELKSPGIAWLTEEEKAAALAPLTEVRS